MLGFGSEHEQPGHAVASASNCFSDAIRATLFASCPAIFPASFAAAFLLKGGGPALGSAAATVAAYFLLTSPWTAPLGPDRIRLRL